MLDQFLSVVGGVVFIVFFIISMCGAALIIGDKAREHNLRKKGEADGYDTGGKG
jgi:hypothetical protein